MIRSFLKDLAAVAVFAVFAYGSFVVWLAM
jgi:hypothetical protein